MKQSTAKKMKVNFLKKARQINFPRRSCLQARIDMHTVARTRRITHTRCTHAQIIRTQHRISYVSSTPTQRFACILRHLFRWHSLPARLGSVTRLAYSRMSVNAPFKTQRTLDSLAGRHFTSIRTPNGYHVSILKLF